MDSCQICETCDTRLAHIHEFGVHMNFTLNKYASCAVSKLFIQEQAAFARRAPAAQRPGPGMQASIHPIVIAIIAYLQT